MFWRNSHKSSRNWVSQANLLSEPTHVEGGAGAIGSNLFLVFETIGLFEQQKDTSTHRKD